MIESGSVIFFLGGTQFPHLTWTRKGPAQCVYMDIVARHCDRVKRRCSGRRCNPKTLSLQKQDKRARLSLCGPLY